MSRRRRKTPAELMRARVELFSPMTFTVTQGRLKGMTVEFQPENPYFWKRRQG